MLSIKSKRLTNHMSNVYRLTRYLHRAFSTMDMAIVSHLSRVDIRQGPDIRSNSGIRRTQ